MSGISPALTEPLINWYQANKRALPWRDEPTPYRVWVSEIMLQQTRVEAVRSFFLRWMDTLPTIQSLAEADESVYLKLWEGLGYYSRVRNLHRAAEKLCCECGGVLPADYQALLRLPGIGEYTAGAIASIAYGIAVPAVDGNVLRVVSRMSDDFTPITDAGYKKLVREKLASIIPADCPGIFNQALMELGATVCLPNGAPLCDSCPVQHLCEGYFCGHTSLLPIRAAKKARRIEERTVLLLRSGSLVGLSKRPDSGLLAGLWELPSLDGSCSAQAVQRILSERGWQIDRIFSLAPARHIFTHVEWHMQGYYIELRGKPAGLTFAAPSALRTKYALPSAFRSFLRVIEEET